MRSPAADTDGVAIAATVCSSFGDFSANRPPRTFSTKRSTPVQPEQRAQGEGLAVGEVGAATAPSESAPARRGLWLSLSRSAWIRLGLFRQRPR